MLKVQDQTILSPKTDDTEVLIMLLAKLLDND